MIKLTAGMRSGPQMIQEKSKKEAKVLKDDIIMSETDESENTACHNFLQNATVSAGLNSEKPYRS
jgi:hypothetical protein